MHDLDAWFKCMIFNEWFRRILLSHTSLNDRVLNQIGTLDHFGSNCHDHTWTTEYYNDQLSTRSLSIHQWKYFQKNLNAQFTEVLSECNFRGPLYLRLEISLNISWIPRYFKTFIFMPKMSFFKENHKNVNSGELLDFYEFTLYMIFAFFLKKSIPIKAPSDNFEIICRVNALKYKNLS